MLHLPQFISRLAISAVVFRGNGLRSMFINILCYVDVAYTYTLWAIVYL